MAADPTTNILVDPNAKPSSSQVANGMGIVQANGKGVNGSGAADASALVENSWPLYNWADTDNYLNSGEYPNGGPVILNDTYGDGPHTDIRDYVTVNLGAVMPFTDWQAAYGDGPPLTRASGSITTRAPLTHTFTGASR